eukprot:3412063-Rhodomonas_salina.1
MSFWGRQASVEACCRSLCSQSPPPWPTLCLKFCLRSSSQSVGLIPSESDRDPTTSLDAEHPLRTTLIHNINDNLVRQRHHSEHFLSSHSAPLAQASRVPQASSARRAAWWALELQGVDVGERNEAVGAGGEGEGDDPALLDARVDLGQPLPLRKRQLVGVPCGVRVGRHEERR